MLRDNKKVAVGLPQNLYNSLKELAKESGRTVPGYIRWLIWRHLDEKDIVVSIFPPEKE